MESGRFDAAFGGGRRDEERARAKERVFSFRDEFGQWEPRAQRAEPWALYNGRIRRGEQIRVFPISNFTELDVWNYIALEELELPSIYFAHEREVVSRDGMLLAASPYVRASRRRGGARRDGALPDGRRPHRHGRGPIERHRRRRRDRRGQGFEISERGETRADDRTSEAAMEDRKREGYF